MSSNRIKSKLRDNQESSENKGESEEKPDNRTLYQVLGIKQNAASSEIKKAYYHLAIIHHPDKGGNPKEFKEISHAYYVLGDEERKKNYDAVIGNESSEKKYKEATWVAYQDWNGKTSYYMDLTGTKLPPEFEDMSLAHDLVYGPVMRPLKKGEILYTVGKPMPISPGKSAVRDEITEGIVMLFRNENDALNYSEANSMNDNNRSKMAVIKVETVTNIEANLIKGPLIQHGFIRERFVYLETDAKNIAPVSSKTSSLTIVAALVTDDQDERQYRSPKGCCIF